MKDQDALMGHKDKVSACQLQTWEVGGLPYFIHSLMVNMQRLGRPPEHDLKNLPLHRTKGKNYNGHSLG